MSEPFQRKYLKAKKNFLVSESLGPASTSDSDERGEPEV